MKPLYRLSGAFLVAWAIFSCAVDTSPEFLPRHFPEKLDSAFVRGELGIIPATLSDKYKLIAWRYLAGLPLNEEEQKGVLAQPAEDGSLKAVEQWQNARYAVSPNGSRRFLTPFRASRVARAVFYENCLPDAFTTAARTLADRQQSYASNEKLLAWAAAQDQVFNNCAGQPPDYPAEPDPASPGLVRADRMYQIAAAHFYAEDLDDAEQRFRAIAADGSSPWRDTAAYMVARSLIRESSLLQRPDALARAKTQLQSISSSTLRDSAQSLVGYIDSMNDPAAAIAPIAQELAVPHPGLKISNPIYDGVYVLTSKRFRKALESPGLPEPFDWIHALESRKTDYAIERWRQSHSTLWLTAATILSDGKRADAPDLIAAGLALPKSSPAFDTVTFNSLRLMIESGQRDEARRRLDDILAGTRRNLDSVDNAFRGERMSVATSFDDFLRWAPRRPIGYVDANVDVGHIDDSPILDEDSVRVLNEFAPLPKLVEATESRRVPDWPRQQIAIITWTRAFVLGNDDAADRMVPLLQKWHTGWGADLENFRAAKGAGKRFAGALLIARHGEFHEHLWSDFPRSAGLDQPGGDWWCVEIPRTGAVAPPDEVLSASEREEAGREVQRLHDAGAAQTFLAPVITGWAASHPASDARVPEALYRLVRITRYGCRGGEDNGRISKAAFDLLHKQYPNTIWARQTPYWFEN